ncbi:MAG: efflux RND transporter permease subunit [Rickettsiales bacterium]|jgi:HAE1 family hydrophobic/amphiphilic exporter-1|nr:efflux RND transporter permease subunit [Rickettsiales bacterium]
MLKFFIKHPVTTLMFVAFWAIMGFVSFQRMNVERMPPMDFPMVAAMLTYPGAGPEEIETQVVKPVENVISRVSGIKKITSNVYDNYAFILTEFNLGERALDKQQEIKGMVDSIMHKLPEALDTPRVQRLNMLQSSVMELAISGADLRDAYYFVDKILSQRITGIEGVADVEIFGGRERAIRVFLDPQRMTAKGISITSVLSAIGAHNLNVPGGKIETHFSSNAVRFMGEFATVDQIGDMNLTTSEGMTFALRDIADIVDGSKDPANGGRFNNEDVMIMSVIKAEDGNAVRISDLLQKRLARYDEMVKKELGAGAEIKIVTDSARSIRNEVESTIWGIGIGVLLTILVLLAFTRNWRSTVIAGAVIPTSLIAGFLFMDFSGFSINMMTLLALASALGTLIANAIILIESALLLMDEKGMDAEEAAIEGTKRTIVAILAGASTNIVVFMPLAFIEGIMGVFMNQFGMSVVYLTLTSLMFSYSLTPMMIAKFLRPTKKTKNAEKKSERKKPLSWFKPCFDSQIRRPWLWVGLSAVLLISSAMLMRFVGNEFSPSADTDEIQIFARAPMGSTYEKSRKLAVAIEEKLAEFPEVVSAATKIGRRGLQNVNITANLIPESMRESDKVIAQRLVAKLAEIPDAEFQVKAGETSGGGANLADTVINVYGEDDIERERAADDLLARINQMEEVQSAILAAQVSNDEIRFIPNQNKMNSWGASNAAVGTAIRTALYGDDTTLKFREKGEEFPLIVEFSKIYKTAEAFGDILIGTNRGMVPVSELGDLELKPASRNIQRVNKLRQTEIYVNLGKSTIGPVRAKINAEIKNMDLPDGVSVRFGGMSELQDESTNELMNTFILATILTFILLAAIMNSISHPFTIALSIFTSFVGVFVFMFLSGATINIGAMLSIIMLVGLAVNNDILLLQPTVEQIDKGHEPIKALWENYIDKFRMVLMTTIAIVAGLLPQLFSTSGFKISMAAVLVGGMIGGLIWSFILTPALFILVEKAREKIFGVQMINRNW